MEAGILRHRLTFQSPTQSQDEYGQNSPTWSDVATVWGEIKPLAGRQLALSQASTRTATATHQIRIRYRANLNKTHRIRFRGRIFHINAMLNVEEIGVELLITATEVKA